MAGGDGGEEGRRSTVDVVADQHLSALGPFFSSCELCCRDERIPLEFLAHVNVEEGGFLLPFAGSGGSFGVRPMGENCSAGGMMGDAWAVAEEDTEERGSERGVHAN